MKRKILLILLLCGLTTVSVVLEYRASAETYACQPPRVCVPDVKIPNCEGAVPLPRSCGFPMKRPQKLSFEAVAIENLNAVSRVSTLGFLRAIRR